MKYGFIIDNRKCIGCHACTVACKAENDVPLGVNRTWVKYIEKGTFPDVKRFFSVMRCNHCEDAPCVEICPVTSLYKREDGIVDFDSSRCIGCKACTQACPYDAIYIDPNTNTAAKCNYCAHRVEKNLEPACVNVCPTNAIISGDLDDSESVISKLLNETATTVRKPEKGTLPQLFYINAENESLVPTESVQSTNYIWNSQSAGVGHFASSSESNINTGEPQKLSEKLLSPRTGEMEKVQENSQSSARQVYDSPAKGSLWGWEVSAYLLTKGISAGLALIVFVNYLFDLFALNEDLQFMSMIVSLLFLGLTGLLLVKDLDKPSRFLYVLLRPQWKSWLVKGAYSIFGFSISLMIWFAGFFSGYEVLIKISILPGILFAVLTAIYTAFLFGQAKGRDFWQNPAMWFQMLIHSVLGGSTVLLLIGNLSDIQPDQLLLNIISVSILLNLILLGLELLTSTGSQDHKLTIKLIIHGRFKYSFWGGVVIFGNLLPLLLLVFLSGTTDLYIALIVLAGLYINENIVVKAPQLIPLS